MSIEICASLFYGFIEKDSKSRKWNKAEKQESDNFSTTYDLAKKLQVVQIEETGSIDEIRCIRISEPEFVAKEETVSIDPKLLIVKPEWEQNLRTYAEAIGLNVSREKPRWHLVLYYND